MSDPRADDPTQNAFEQDGLDKGTGDPNDDRAYLEDMPPAQVDEEAVESHLDDIDSDEADADA